MKRNKETIQDEVVKKLSRLAERAAKARDKLDEALEKARTRRDWNELCERHGIDPESNFGDWMA